jgi:flavin reductase (DIM6/NTAB) family NADH-FMN oxidoreductase RutF
MGPMELEGAPPAHRVETAGATQQDRDRYRELASDIAAGVGVVAARHRGRDVAATVTGILDVSYDPPTLLVSLFDEGRICDAVQGAEAWTLSLLRRDQQGIANWLASPGNPVHGLLNTVPFRRAPHSGAAVVDGALAWFDLRTVAAHPAATHMLFVGEVVAMGRGTEGSADDDPLLHFAGGYRGIAHLE